MGSPQGKSGHRNWVPWKGRGEGQERWRVWAASRIKGSDKDARFRGRAKVMDVEAPGPLLIFTSSYLYVLFASPLAAFWWKLPDNKGCHRLSWFTSNQDKVVCKAFLVQKKRRGSWQQISLWPRSWAAWVGWVCIGWLPVIYLFSWSKRRGEKKEPSMGGMGEYKDLCELLDLWEGKADQIWGHAKWPLSISVNHSLTQSDAIAIDISRSARGASRHP